MKVIVVGGGIGGLVAALCFARAGHEVVVLEQAHEIGEVGAGLQLSPNATRILRELGLLDDIAARAFEPQAIELRLGESGRRVMSLPLADTARQRWGSPYLHIHRADLIDVLAEAVRRAAPAAIHTATRVTGYRNHDGGVAAIMSTGEEIEGDLLVGADGIHSAVRAQMLGADQPRFTGNVAWRLTVPVERLPHNLPPPTACIWAGTGRHAVTYYLRSGRLVNFVGIVERDDWRREGWSETGSRDEVAADFANWAPVISAIVREAETFHRWALFDRQPLARWCDGHVALLGDACHPMLPSLAQGAVMAIEDAATLVRLVGNRTAVKNALTTYERIRLPRTSRVQAVARANLRAYHLGSQVGRAVAYTPLWLVSQLAPGLALSRLDWLFGHRIS